MINLKRVYEGAAKSDGVRILVERLWPRGLVDAVAAASDERRPGHDGERLSRGAAR